MAKPGRGDKPRKRRGWLIAILVVFALGLGAVTTGWILFEDKIREVLGWEDPDDYEGTGHGEVLVVVNSGYTGIDVGNALEEAGVIMDAGSFYDMLIETEQNPNFIPGTFQLRLQMSNASALELLMDPASKLELTVLIPEGRDYMQTLELVAAGTEIPLEELEAAVEPDKLADYGIPAEAPIVEGYLFPATYNFEPGLSAEEVIQIMVNRTFQSLQAAGVPEDEYHDVLTLASIIQREAGSNQDDFYKVSRVFHNRLEEGWNLESDATVSYGTGRTHNVQTTPEERADRSNPYNTYANPGLPVGPIGGPGDVAIDAAMNPADGPWFFFVAIDMRTGETVFSTTFAEHQTAVNRWIAWCNQSPENDAMCD